jgi:hypothetical protein
MSTTPLWQTTVAGTTALAASVDQLLSAHPAQLIYQGTSYDSDTTSGSGATDSTYNLSLANKFTTAASGVGSTALTRLDIYMVSVGTGATLTLSIQTDSTGKPSGTNVSGLTMTIPSGFPPPIGMWISVPMPLTGLTPSTPYWIVIGSTSSATNYAELAHSGTAGGRAATNNGGGWVNQTYSYNFAAYDGINLGDALRHTWEDSGALWNAYYYGTAYPYGSGLPTTIMNAVGTTQWAVRTLTYDATTNYLIAVT